MHRPVGSSRTTLVTGTCAEFSGRRPLPRSLRDRSVVVLCGPTGVGRSAVAQVLLGPDLVRLDARRFESVCIARLRTMRWPDALVARGSLLLDQPKWLSKGTCRVRLAGELITARMAAGLKTVVTLDDADAENLLDELPPSEVGLAALHFPRGRRARLTYAQGVAEELGLDLAKVAGTHQLDPWTYEAVRAALRAAAGPANTELREAERAVR